MPPVIPGSVDAKNNFEDLSGVNSASFSNPYDALIEACNDDPAQLQSRYSMHRKNRNAQQKAKLLSSDFEGLILDNILQRLEDPSLEPGYVDPRNCLCIWARPPLPIRNLVSEIQQKLLVLAPHMWVMPVDRLHLTALELTHSHPDDSSVSAMISQLEPSIPAITDYPTTHRSRLIKPLLSFDAAAIALSFLPAAGEGLSSHPSSTSSRPASADKYSYHHLRRDLFTLATSRGIEIESRYVVPSAHITLGRFLTQRDHDSKAKMEQWISGIEALNDWLQELWPNEEGIKEGGEWEVGREKGLDLRKGLLWYGGGETVRLGQGY